MSTWYLNSLALDTSEGIFLSKIPAQKSGVSYDANSQWMGNEVRLNNFQSKETRMIFSGFCTSAANLRKIMVYSDINYNWNVDSLDVYLSLDLTRKWKVKAIHIDSDFEREDIYPFDMEVYLDSPAAVGYSQYQESGTLSSPTTISSCTNNGDIDAYFEEIIITGSYTSGSNLQGLELSHNVLGYSIDFGDEIFDGATYTFYEDCVAKYYYQDLFADSNKFTRNQFSSSSVTFDTDHLDFANSSSLVFKHQLGHPLLQDPILKLTITGLTGDPVLEVSPDNSTWWEVDRALQNGVETKYTLTKLAGYSTFYWRIVCDSDDSLTVSKMIFESWHTYTGSIPLPYIQAGVTDDTLTLTYSAGGGTYDIRWRDKYSI